MKILSIFFLVFLTKHNRYDRDQFIDIIWGNVVRGADDQFLRYSHNLSEIALINRLFFEQFLPKF